MRNIAACALLGLSVVASNLAVTKPAAALPPFVLVNDKSELADPNHPQCMGVSGGPHNGHITGGTNIITWECTFATDQVFTFAQTPGLATFMFQDQITGPQGQAMCLTDVNYSSDSGKPVQIEPCTGGRGQQFWLLGNNGCFWIQNAYSGRVMGVANGSANPIKHNMQIVMWDENASTDQLWCPYDASIPIG
jgi:hypothetical protein